jgi:hypothetical protein
MDDAARDRTAPPEESFRASLSISPKRILVQVGLAAGLAAAAVLAFGILGTRSTPFTFFTVLAWMAGGLLLVGLGTAGLFFRGPRHEGLRAAVAGIAAFLVLLIPANLAVGRILGLRVDSWKRRGEEIAAFVEARRASTGSYPRTLQDVEYAPRLKGTLSYSSDGKKYELIVYDPTSFFGCDGWDWNPATHEWKRFWD